MRLLVTGALGYIGSHFSVEALKKNHELILLDKLEAGAGEIHKTIERLGGAPCRLIHVDMNDVNQLDKLFKDIAPLDAVIHFAAKKNAFESLSIPVSYYQNNLACSIHLLTMMQKYQVNKLVFSSTAAVYADGVMSPIDETMPTLAATPYGRSKRMVEKVLDDVCTLNQNISCVSLRYFNAVGAHDSGLLGQVITHEKESNIMSAILKVAMGRHPALSIYGKDYPTVDGTAVRDYVHVKDLALGHLKSLDYLANHQGFSIFNLGCGEGKSILELVHTFEKQNGISIPFEYKNRRPGDFGEVYANVNKAKKLLNWCTEIGLSQAVRDDWHRVQNILKTTDEF